MEIVPAPTVGHQTVPLEAASPFEMRVDLGEGVPDMDIRTALKTGELGFLHSFTTGSAVDGPGIRVVGWTTAIVTVYANIGVHAQCQRTRGLRNG